MRLSLLFLFILLVLISSCGSEKKSKPAFYDNDNTTSVDYDYDYSGETVSVPYRELGGVKIVAVKINGLAVDMIFDTGCSNATISSAEANYLYQKGWLKKEDILGTSHSQIADGSIVENCVVNLKEVIIDDKLICHNVKATVIDNAQAPLLLGNDILDRAESFTIDQSSHSILFKLK